MRLDELVVSNLGVLADATLEPAPGLTVVTGETGTGKTLLLGALVALLGGGLRPERIGPAGDEVAVSARFVGPDGDEVVARLRLGRGGRTRAYLDGAAASAAEVAARVGGLVDVVAQHDGLRLRRADVVRAMVDTALDAEGLVILDAYRAAWEHLEECRREMARLGGDTRTLERERATARHEAEEIAAVDPSVGEDEEVAALIDRLRHAQELAELAATAELSIEAAMEALGSVVDAGRRIDRLDPAAALAPSTEGAAAEVSEVASDLRRYAEAIVHDPEGLERLQARQARLADLKRRYGDDLATVLAHAGRAGARATELEALLARAGDLGDALGDAEAAVGAAGERLREERRRSADRLTAITEEHLGDLGFSDPVVAIVFEPQEAGPHGADRAELRFASDRRLRPGPVSTTASGGELSRLVLALRLATGVGDVPVVVFDEIDAGVGGETALALAEKLHDVAADSQVLCVTHLPQVAAFADLHVVVDREGPTAGVRVVEGEDRLTEITRMLSGLSGSERGRHHALELVERANLAKAPTR